ncbi:MAG: glycerophosphodiester phosphodiesterase family protein [Pirellulales bacterium]|nr:glycerophosphodiester phosphodiesterase family protein [Pirellulales bacterium]
MQRCNLVMLMALFAGAVPSVPTSGVEPLFEPIEPPRRVQLMLHRGALRQAPENTAPAIQHAIDDGLEWVEVDVRLSRDRQHVLVHNDAVDQVSNGHGRVADLTLAELQKLDAGSWFAPRFAGTRFLSLAECLALAKGKINLYLDIKAADPRRLVDEIRAAGVERQVLVYDDAAAVAEVRRISEVTVPIMLKWRPGDAIETFVRQHQPTAVEIDAADVSTEACQEFHGVGVKVQAKTLGDDDRPDVWERVLSTGVDFLQTDRAEELLAFRLRELRQRTPVKIAFHRGAKRYAPENTLAALEKAIALGADFVEFDVRLTSDKQAVLLHDATLDRTTNGLGPVAALALADVQKLDAGSWFGQPFANARVPTLDEFLTAIRGRAKLYFDAKNIPPEQLAEALARYGLVDDTVVFQGPAYLAKLRAIEPRIRRMPPLYRPEQLDKLIETVAPYAVDAAWENLSAELIARCHERGVQVFSDGIEESVADYARAIGWGIDLIQTDHPLRVLRAVELSVKP